LAILQKPRRQGAGHHDGIFGDLADKRLAGVAIDDLGGSAKEHAHRQHRALAHDHALGDFRARTDEAIVLDDHGFGLQRLEHAADADAAGNVHALADLGAGADRGPGVDHGRFIDIGAEIDEGRHQHDILAMKAERRTMAPGTARKPASRKRFHPSPRISRAPCPTMTLFPGHRRSRSCR